MEASGQRSMVKVSVSDSYSDVLSLHLAARPPLATRILKDKLI